VVPWVGRREDEPEARSGSPSPAPPKSPKSWVVYARARRLSEQVGVVEGVFEGLGGSGVSGLAAQVDVLGDGDFGLA
jgi:hypothetical protein